MASSHLLVSRAGAITLAEICAAGRASLLVPLAIAQGHQVDNARVLADAGAAEMGTPGEATPEGAPGRPPRPPEDHHRPAPSRRALRSPARGCSPTLGRPRWSPRES